MSLLYYDCFNFIFDSIGILYFYQHSYDRNKAPVHVIDFDSDKPVFINLNPDDITIIPESAIKNLIISNILSFNQFCRIVRVISAKDSIKSKCLAPLMDILNDRVNHIFYSIRKTTLEETVVLDFKKRQEFFYAGKLIWDSTKIWFD